MEKLKQYQKVGSGLRIMFIAFFGVFVYCVYLGRSYLFFERFIEDNEKSELIEE